MSLDFEKTAVEGNEFVRLVAEELEVSLDKAGRIIRALIHALRSRLSYKESFQLLAELPVWLTVVYVAGWRFDKNFNRISHVNDFLDEVTQEDGGLAAYDFGKNSKAGVAVASVFKALKYFVSEEEINDIFNVMPTELKQFIKESIAV